MMAREGVETGLGVSSGPPRVLVIYCSGTWPLRAAIEEHLYSFRRSPEASCVHVNLSLGWLPDWIARQPWDLIVFHTIFLASRWDLPAFDKFRRRASALRAHKAVKIALPQDEFLNTDALAEFLREFGVERVFSVAPESEWSKIYAGIDRERVAIERVLTGYLEPRSVERIERLSRRIPERSVDIGYRAFDAPAWLGRHGRLKTEVARRFSEAARARRLVADISTRREDTLLGRAWWRHLLSCRYTVGVEGGASLLDRDGSLRARTEAFVEKHPDASFEEIEAACFPGRDGELDLFALSPRHLEACATRTCQVLIEGDYDGVLEADRHYIPLRPDFSNLDEVLDRIASGEGREDLVDRAYRDIVASGRYSYARAVERILESSLASRPTGSASARRQSLDRWLRVRDRISWGAVAVGGRARSAWRRLRGRAR